MDHIIQNFDRLATSALRKSALRIAEAGLKAINTTVAVKQAVNYEQRKQVLTVGGHEPLTAGGGSGTWRGKKYQLSDFERIMVVGFGKAAFEAASALQAMLADKITCGYVIDLKEGDLGNITCRIGTHPYPTKVNIEATKELLAMLGSCTEKDLVLCLVSGGGSALLCYPHQLTCEAEVAIIAALTAAGATIQEMNTVRKHISQVKGGQLAKLMYPATIASLIFSDVPGDDLSMVASGPTVPDSTTMRDASDILKKYNVLEVCQLPICRLLETPKEKKYFEKVQNVLAVSANIALSAMKEEAENLGFEAKIFSPSFQGIARELGPQIAAAGKPHECLLGAGESTVRVTGQGQGGRNQEMALAALPLLDENQVLACVASDGHDNTDAAGALADSSTQLKAKALGLDSRIFLDGNDSYHFFEAVDDLIITGPTGANVADFFVCLRQ